MRLSEIEHLNNARDATRLLKLLEYPDDEIVGSLVSEYNMTEDEARAVVAEQS